MTEARRARCAAIDILYQAARHWGGDKNTKKARRKQKIPLDLGSRCLPGCRVEVLCDNLSFSSGWSQPIHCIIVRHLICNFFSD